MMNDFIHNDVENVEELEYEIEESSSSILDDEEESMLAEKEALDWTIENDYCELPKAFL